ncbi:MAG: hypothetical protein AMXMBFR13_18470 [Phycisphaerae bacterium]
MNSLAKDVGIAFWRLLPANPIVLRVVHVGSKRMQHLWARVAYLVVLLVVMMIMYMSASGSSGPSSGSLADMAKSATKVFELIANLQLAMMCLLAPIFTAGAISQEKDAETFNVLLTTPLTNAQIVLGSLLSRLFFVIMLLLSGLPIFCITMLYGGVTTDQVFRSFGIAGCTAALTGALAILISVMRVGTRGTIFSFYMGNIIFLLLGLALGMQRWTYIPESQPPVNPNEGTSWLAGVHPFLAQWVALGWTPVPDTASVAHYAWPFDRIAAAPDLAYMVITLTASALMVGLATFFVRRGIKQGEATAWSRLFKRKGLSAEGERTRRARRVWSNPVAWREATTRANAATSNSVRYGYIVGAVVAAVAYLFFLGEGAFTGINEARMWLTWIVLMEFGTVLLMAANTAATAITREREAGTMELLLSTPLTSKYIVWGKLRGLVSFALPLMTLPAITVLAVAVFQLFAGEKFPGAPVVSWLSVFLLPLLLAVYSAFACMMGLHMSLKSRRSVQAVMASIGILVVVAFGLGLCAFATASSDAAPIAALTAPLTFVMSIFYVLNPDELTGRAWRTSAGDLSVFMTIGTLVALGLYGAIVAGTYRSMVTNFDMIVRKQSR